MTPCHPVWKIVQLGYYERTIPYCTINSMLHLYLQRSLSPLSTAGPCWKWRRRIHVWVTTKPWPLVSNQENGWCWVTMTYGPCTIRSLPYWYGIIGQFGFWRKGGKRGTKEVGLIYTLSIFLNTKEGYYKGPPPIFGAIYEIKDILHKQTISRETDINRAEDTDMCRKREKTI